MAKKLFRLLYQLRDLEPHGVALGRQFKAIRTKSDELAYLSAMERLRKHRHRVRQQLRDLGVLTWDLPLALGPYLNSPAWRRGMLRYLSSLRPRQG